MLHGPASKEDTIIIRGSSIMPISFMPYGVIMRIPDVLGRGGGGQYPHGIVVDDVLHVIYSMGKEDIAVSSIGLSELGFQ